jgi:hypothetical protein
MHCDSAGLTLAGPPPAAEATAAARAAEGAPHFPPPHPSGAALLPLERQVFISHTGRDGGAKTFAASILRPALEAAGLAVCMDFVSLEPGCKWPEELVGAAANSMVVVVVLSKSYSTRFWCMLELDLALNSHHQHQEGGEAGSSHSQPLVIPVFYDSPDEVVDAASIRQHWSAGSLEERLRRDEELGPEWVPVVDVSRWADNVVAMAGHWQNLRRNSNQEAEKDEELQLAKRVVKAAVMHIPSLVDVGVEVVGFEEQEAVLLADLGGPERLGVWLYGQGAAPKAVCLGLASGSSMQSILCCAFDNRSVHKCHSIRVGCPVVMLAEWWEGIILKPVCRNGQHEGRFLAASWGGAL